MTPTKLLVGQIIVVFVIVILGLWAATQWAAAMLGYQAQLGAPWAILWDMPIYRPWQLFIWWYHFEAYAPHVFDKAGALAGASGFLGCAAAIIGSLWRARQNRHVTTYGSSRWASRREIKRVGLFRDAGVFLGRLGKDYLRHDGPEHVMAFAPTRSGKGVGLVVPSLLSWTGSTVVHDIKGENWQLTAGWRSRFSHCLLFNPTDPRSARYNPLLEVRKGPDEVRDVQNIADVLVDPEGALERRSHWEKTSHSLLVGAILHVLYAEEEKTLARVATFLSDPQRSFAHTLRRMMATNHLGTKEHPQVHPVVASAAREVLNKSENERSGVLSTAMSFLGLYRDPIVARNTSSCDWRIADLVDAKSPVSLYLLIPPSDISRTKPLVRLVLNQIGRRLTERLEGDPAKSRKHQLLMMLDEFPALGRLDFFETALAFMAGYGIRAYLIAQSLNQISKAYGENNAILDNCHVRIGERAVQRHLEPCDRALVDRPAPKTDRGDGAGPGHQTSAPPPKEKKLRKKLDAAKAMLRPNTIWMSLRKPPLVSPKASARPVVMMIRTATILATGPWTDSSTCCSGSSQGIPDPAAIAVTGRINVMAAASGNGRDTCAWADELRLCMSVYRATYDDKAATIADLIPAMLHAFLASDRAFARARKEAEAQP
jgi:type IV secretion system protein VirD4